MPPYVSEDCDNDNHVCVSYPVRYSTATITKAEFALIRSLPDTKRVSAIRFIRDQYGLGLYEAKQIVDTICAMPLQEVA